jgi:UDP-2,4-diacetamido-2,4,6-trideoxy-beta-L-altropyranose hydrolase
MTRLPDLVILTEGDWARGLGHLGRCLGYAQHWRRMGRQVLWIVDGDDAARRFLDGETVVWRRWQEGGDTPEVKGAVAIADSYSASPAALHAIGDRAAAAVYLDDLELDDYPPGLVVHSAPGPLDRSGRRAQWLIGPAWQPMPAPFWTLAGRKPAIDEIRSILVLVGGTDLRDLGRRLATLARRFCPDSRIDLVLGAGARSEGADFGHVTVHRALPPAALRDLMLDADLAISAAGQTLYQLARCGVPTLMIGVAENQVKHLREWPETGAMASAGTWDASDLDQRILDGLDSVKPAQVRADMSKAAQAVVDGQGAARLARFIGRTRP